MIMEALDYTKELSQAMLEKIRSLSNDYIDVRNNTSDNYFSFLVIHLRNFLQALFLIKCVTIASSENSKSLYENSWLSVW